MSMPLFSRATVLLTVGVLLTLAPDGPSAQDPRFPRQERAVLKRLPSIVKSVRFSGDGKWLAACGGQEVKVWDAATLKEVATLGGYRLGVADIAFSPDGKTLATTGYKEPSRLYDTRTWKLRAKLAGNPEGTIGAAFSPDGKVLALLESGGVMRLIRLWDPATGKELGATIALGVPHLHRMAFCPDGKTLAGSGQEKVVLYDLAAKKVRATLGGHDPMPIIDTLAFSPDGKTLLTGDCGLDNKVQRVFLWDVATGKRKRHLDISEAFGCLHGGTFSPDSKTVALVGFSPFVHLYDVGTGKQWHVLKSDQIDYDCVAFSPDGRTLAAGCNDGRIKLWDVPKKK